MNDSTVSSNKTIRSVFKYIDADRVNCMNEFYSEGLIRKYKEFRDIDLAMMFLNENIGISNEDVFKNYSGYNFRNINNLLRGKWNYEENGHSDRQEEYEKIAFAMREAISNNPTSIGNTKVFRGVTLDYFRDYGVFELSDLARLKNDYLFDKGFVSTSLVREKSFYQKENELGLNYNVGIEYLIPEEFDDGACMGFMSYNPEQCEYVINTGNLARVVSVDVQDDSAYIQAMLIPKKIYDDYYIEERGIRK